MRFTLLKIIGETVSSDSWAYCNTHSRENATPPGKKTAVSFLPTVEYPTLPAVETGQRPLLHGKCRAVFPKTGRFYYIRKRTRPFKKGGQRRSRPHGSALFHRACGRPPQRSAAQFVGGYVCCTTGFGSPRFSTLESLISFLGQTVAHRPQLSHLE